MRVTISKEVVARDLAGEAILLDMNTKTYFGLDAVGSRIWRLLAEHQSTEAIVPFLLQEFEVDEQRMRQDLQTLVLTLLEKRLLIAAPDPD